jgi:hypothetical protein
VLSEWSLALKFCIKTMRAFLFQSLNFRRLVHFTLFKLIIRNFEKSKSRSLFLRNFLHSVTSPILHLNSPFSSHSSLFEHPIYVTNPPRSVWTIIFDTHKKKITSKLILRYVLIFKPLYSRRENKRFGKVRWKNSPYLISS